MSLEWVDLKYDKEWYYILYILEIYRVDISILGILPSSLMLTNIKFLFWLKLWF